ncbi:hypothetical protein AWH56_005970 [Anaerobacillus isosaccharinicus]|uniref:Uncharacterized protein n=1 Tax=Anaerobacillus isosaccharinicus TaxID=1532552 RepID=A0A7S7L9X2_9BACI|nr:hypothetical protein [Anaerobacillus isosaccharinicus]MBA5584428.1 hypothetical protein [Anaerobacillus isosaccharinicus]QOY37183.1 hypothetical protein AWH56_005970 [Anaerobacillus isosaccharinicus]
MAQLKWNSLNNGHWVNGDIDGFAKSFNALDGEDFEFNEMLFGERDLNMAAKSCSY